MSSTQKSGKETDMTSLKYVTDDLVEMAKSGKFDVIVQGCNCFCTQGAGIAKTISQTWPEVLKIDCMTPKGDRNKLGKISVAEIDRDDCKLVIVNAYTQFHWKPQNGQSPVDYHAIRDCMKVIKKKFTGKQIGMPLIGAGLAGGDWDIIEGIIERELDGEDVTIVKWIGDA